METLLVGIKTEAAMIADVERRMVAEFDELPATYVLNVVNQACARFADSPVREFVPLLVERRARRQLAPLVGGLLVSTG